VGCRGTSPIPPSRHNVRCAYQLEARSRLKQEAYPVSFSLGVPLNRTLWYTFPRHDFGSFLGYVLLSSHTEAFNGHCVEVSEDVAKEASSRAAGPAQGDLWSLRPFPLAGDP
jgi:hypothetical protein